MTLRLHERMDPDRDEGATALEYGVLVALIAIVIVVGVAAFGDQVLALLEAVTQRAGELLG